MKAARRASSSGSFRRKFWRCKTSAAFSAARRCVMRFLACAFALVAGFACAFASPAAAADWPVFGHDPARSGVDAGDTVLTTRNVGRLRARWQIRFGAGVVADSTPILLDTVPFRGKTRTMLFQTAKNGTT